jgi:transposase InsO family protein
MFQEVVHSDRNEEAESASNQIFLSEARMDIHQNARLTLRSREAMVFYVLKEGFTRKAAAAAFRVSARTVAKWVGRYLSEGSSGLMDRSSRPRRSPRRVAEPLRARVLELRLQRQAAYWIAQQTQLSTATVSRILRRARLSRWRDLHPRPEVMRYEHPHPGDMVHLDIKGMTRFAEVSQRGDGRLRGKQPHPGFCALHIAIDDRSRVAFVRMLPDQTAETTIGFLRDAAGFFAERNVQIRQLLTDNGSAYRSHRFRAACEQMQLKHRRTRPYTPRTNGKAERFIQTALREWAYREHWLSSEERDAQLQPWVDFYNMQRPHGSLNFKPPISRLDNATTS